MIGMDIYWDMKQIRGGDVVWQETKKNLITRQGQQIILNKFFRGISFAETVEQERFYIRFCNTSLNAGSTLVDARASEPFAYGYAPQLVTRDTSGWPTIELDSQDYRITSRTVSITAIGGTVGPVNTMFLATTGLWGSEGTDATPQAAPNFWNNTGLLISRVQLSATRTLLDGDTMQARLIVKLGQCA